jgi:phage virion morphogenesis protein
MPITARVDDREVRIGLGEFRSGVGDMPALLKIVGDLMMTSVARTFRDEGSPAGYWPALALSTLRGRKYKTGIHKLLVLSGRLFRSISYDVSGDTLTIGTNVAYARVHQFGSADRMGGSIGPQAKLPDRRVLVSNYDALRIQSKQYGRELRTGKDGKQMSVRMRLRGPLNATRYHVGEHSRHQNIPARAYLVFRPEDPARFVSGIEAYLGLHAVRLGKVATA